MKNNNFTDSKGLKTGITSPDAKDSKILMKKQASIKTETNVIENKDLGTQNNPGFDSVSKKESKISMFKHK